jgi:hypothetical protein
MIIRRYAVEKTTLRLRFKVNQDDTFFLKVPTPAGLGSKLSKIRFEGPYCIIWELNETLNLHYDHLTP